MSRIERALHAGRISGERVNGSRDDLRAYLGDQLSFLRSSGATLGAGNQSVAKCLDDPPRSPRHRPLRLVPHAPRTLRAVLVGMLRETERDARRLAKPRAARRRWSRFACGVGQRPLRRATRSFDRAPPSTRANGQRPGTIPSPCPCCGAIGMQRRRPYVTSQLAGCGWSIRGLPSIGTLKKTTPSLTGSVVSFRPT